MTACSKLQQDAYVMGDKLTVRVDPELFIAVKLEAVAKGQTLAHLVEDALRAYLATSGEQRRSEEPPADYVGDAEPAVTSRTSKIEVTLAEHAEQLHKIQRQIAALRAASAPKRLKMPNGSFSKVETMILRMVCDGGIGGASAAEIEARLDGMGITLGPRRDALSKLGKAGILRRARKRWVLATQVVPEPDVGEA